MNRKSLLAGIILGIAVVVSLGIVYIDNIKHYFYQAGGVVQMVVNTNYVFGVDTNTGRVGWNVTNTTTSFQIVGKKPATNTSSVGASAGTTGQINTTGGTGGSTFIPTTGTGGTGGSVIGVGGVGGSAPAATTNATGGTGGSFNFSSGAGGTGDGVATNSATGGGGGLLSLIGGNGGNVDTTAATNTASGGGGGINITTGSGLTPGAGWARRSGPGGLLSLTAGESGNATRTNSGAGGSINLLAGNSGNVLTAPGEPGIAGNVNITAGGGGSGGTNANGGSVYFLGGTGAISGNIVIGRNVAGLSRGGLQVGPLVAGTTGTMTNLLSVTAVLDFGSIAAGTIQDLPVAFAGAADGDVVTLGVPLSSVTNCTWMGFASNAVVYVRAANGQLVTAQDPNSGVFRIVVQKFQ